MFMAEKCIRNVTKYKGQYKITIPKHIAQVLGLEHKDPVEFLLEHGDIVMRTVK